MVSSLGGDGRLRLRHLAMLVSGSRGRGGSGKARRRSASLFTVLAESTSPARASTWAIGPPHRWQRRLEFLHKQGDEIGKAVDMVDELRERGHEAGKHRVARLMRENGIWARIRRRFRHTTDSNQKLSIAPNLRMAEWRARKNRR
jgi:hypothetical protein